MGLFGRKSSSADRSAPSQQATHEFAIVDVETTGLDRQSDRMIEIAVIVANAVGEVIYEWTTLVNCGAESAGPTAIHGITDEMLAVSPPSRQSLATWPIC